MYHECVLVTGHPDKVSKRSDVCSGKLKLMCQFLEATFSRLELLDCDGVLLD